VGPKLQSHEDRERPVLVILHLAHLEYCIRTHRHTVGLPLAAPSIDLRLVRSGLGAAFLTWSPRMRRSTAGLGGIETTIAAFLWDFGVIFHGLLLVLWALIEYE
jgi:hypothetical protein